MGRDGDREIDIVVSVSQLRLAIAALERRWSELDSIGAPLERQDATWAAVEALREQLAFNEEGGE